MAHLNIGDKIPTITGEWITVDEEIGNGGEGVYGSYIHLCCTVGVSFNIF